MKSNYDILGNHIRLIDTRNRESITDRVLGINIDKFFMPSVANVIGTDLSKYKLITKGKFACNPMHVGRDERLPVALYDEEEPAIVSPAYFMFEVIDNSILNEDYLMMWFRRPEFDRICWLHTDGSVRGGITWDDICRLELPIPPIENQLEIVNSYKAITERIALKQKINDNLAEYLNCIYIKLTKDMQSTTSLSTICDYVTEKVFFSEVDTSVYISTENILPDKQGIASFGMTSPSDRVTYFRERDVLVSNIRPYFKKMWFATTSGGCNADVLCFRALDKRYSYLLKSILFQDSFFDYVMSGAKGTKMPRGDKKHIMQYQIPCFLDTQLQKFNELASSIEHNQALNRQEISALESAKEILLTTLSR